MATVKVTLSLSSTDVLTSDLSLSVTSNLLADSGSLIRAKVKGTSADTDDLVIYKANDKLESAVQKTSVMPFLDLLMLPCLILLC